MSRASNFEIAQKSNYSVYLWFQLEKYIMFQNSEMAQNSTRNWKSHLKVTRTWQYLLQWLFEPSQGVFAYFVRFLKRILPNMTFIMLTNLWTTSDTCSFASLRIILIQRIIETAKFWAGPWAETFFIYENGVIREIQNLKKDESVDNSNILYRFSYHACLSQGSTDRLQTLNSHGTSWQ